MEVHAQRTPNEEEQVHEYESMTEMYSQQTGITELEKPTKLTDKQRQKKMTVSFIMVSFVLFVAVITLSVMIYTIRIDMNMTKMMSFQTENRLTELNTSLQDTKMIFLRADSGVNELNISIQDIVDKEEDRVAVTACTNTKTYASNDLVPFKNIKTVNGISTIGLNSMKTTGKFTCESPGLFLISLFVQTKTHKSSLKLFKNDQTIATDFFSLNEHYQTNSVTLLEKLNVGDSVLVKTNDEMYIYGGRESCLSVLQIN